MKTKTAVILAAGEGTRIWPYAEIRPKALIPIAGTPVAAHQAALLRGLGIERIVVVAGRMGEQLAHLFRGDADVFVIRVPEGGPRGTAFSLAAAAEAVGEQPALVLYGDTLLEAGDVRRLIERFEALAPGEGAGLGGASDGEFSAQVSCEYGGAGGDTRGDCGGELGGGSGGDSDGEFGGKSRGGTAVALVSPLAARGEESGDWICCSLKPDGAGGTLIDAIVGHPRDGCTHRFAAFAVDASFFGCCASNSGIFTNVQVGMMPPLEGHLEMSLADRIAEGRTVAAVEAEGACWDLDKPWHIMQANDWMVAKLCRELTANELAEGASIDETAVVNGFVRLGPGSRIGRHVRIDGNAIIGANTVIENGALLQGRHVIGSDTYIGNYCYLSEGATVGSRCVINHCAELDGLIFDNVYLYHYMEFYGIIGTSTDLGAATVCGTLRFDDGLTTHRVKGRRETPREHANAIYLGDFARTGVNAILMPGVKVGVYSVVGPGVILHEDVPNRTIVSVKQELVSREWGPQRYGW